jgi:hypothetical protein
MAVADLPESSITAVEDILFLSDFQTSSSVDLVGD